MNSKANVIIAPKSLQSYNSFPPEKTIILTDNPMLLFPELQEIYLLKCLNRNSNSAYIHPEAIIGENVHIGAFCYISKCSIGANTIILNNVNIEDGVSIGENVYIKMEQE